MGSFAPDIPRGGKWHLPLDGSSRPLPSHIHPKSLPPGEASPALPAALSLPFPTPPPSPNHPSQVTNPEGSLLPRGEEPHSFARPVKLLLNLRLGGMEQQ